MPCLTVGRQKSFRKRASKTSSIPYFTQETENAVVLYNTTNNQIERNRIYRALLEKPFAKLAENILNTFKFSYFDDSINNTKNDVVAFMMEKVALYDQSKGKAFSYFSIVAKNYLILINNTNYKRFRIHDGVDALDFDRNFQGEHRQLEKTIEDREFIEMMITFWENNLATIFHKSRDVQIANAILELFRKIDGIENFNKKALYVMVREIVDCNTQQVTKIISTMRKHYGNMVQEYGECGIINTDNINTNKFF